MKNKIIAIAAFSALSLGAFAGGKQEAKKTEQKPVEIIISAAASLTDAMNELIALYKTVEPSVTVTPTYGSSGSLQKQIEQGAPADLFFSAAVKQMQALDDQSLLLPGTRKNMLVNSLVLVTPKDKTDISAFTDAATDKIKQIAIGEPASVPAGQYAMQAFTSLGIADAVKAKSVYAKDVRQVLAYVESGEVDAGAVYATDAATSKSVRVAAAAPDGSIAPVVYPAAVVKTSANPEVAKKFLDWLSGPDAGAVFVKYGFAIAK